MKIKKILLTLIVFQSVIIISEASAQEFYNPKPMALGGAYTALADGNDALYLNPAGLSLQPMYHVDLSYALNSWAGANRFNVSIKDSETTRPLAAGFGFTYMWENENLRDLKGYRVDFGLSYIIATWCLLGGSIRYFSFDVGDVEGKWANATVDAGALFPFHKYFALSLTGKNLIRAGDEPPPIKSTQGIRVGNFEYFNLLFDVEQDYTSRDTVKLIYHGGGELMLGKYFALRVGYMDDYANIQKYFCGGLAFISPKFGIDFSIKQRVGGGKDFPTADRFLAFGLRMFM